MQNDQKGVAAEKRMSCSDFLRKIRVLPSSPSSWFSSSSSSCPPLRPGHLSGSPGRGASGPSPGAGAGVGAGAGGGAGVGAGPGSRHWSLPKGRAGPGSAPSLPPSRDAAVAQGRGVPREEHGEGTDPGPALHPARRAARSPAGLGRGCPG